ncbi:PaaI family thioesterase [Pontitalea aquivivens]|uniref:PaaI family thioesterase n=1 Tax=Pontitalea aquivivens TaxID=3388663 RepID=UPI00397055E5
MTLIMHSAEDAPPGGFEPVVNRTEGENFAGPYYLRQSGSDVSMGFRVHPRHLNRTGVCHGGFIATFADLQGYAIKRGVGIAGISPTINLSVDFVRPVPNGSWVESTPQVVQRTNKMLFFQTLITADGLVAARASGIFKLNLNQPVPGDPT